MDRIKLIVGLGNIGRDYENTRHNAGFWWAEQLAHHYQLPFSSQKKFFGQLATRVQGTEKTWILKPETLMNGSGRAVAAVAAFYQIEATEILVVHDELDLMPGTIKLKKAGGHGGHNGLRDIIAQLGRRDFWRLRVGIGHPGDRTEVTRFVLSTPGKSEREQIDQSLDKAMACEDLILAGKMEAAMLKLHSK